MSLSGARPLLVRAASSATVTLVLLSALLLYVIFKDGWEERTIVNAIVLVSLLWVLGWPFVIVMSAAKRLGTAWGKKIVTDEPSETSTDPPPSSTLAKLE